MISALPIKYLGLPLTTTLMSKNGYEPLLAIIRARFQSWTSKSLSFVGRLMLIKSVITSTTNFWCSDFRLPKACTDDIDSMCSEFLWSGSPNDSTQVKVAWKEVCSPLEEGGLGVWGISEVTCVFPSNLYGIYSVNQISFGLIGWGSIYWDKSLFGILGTLVWVSGFGENY